MIIIHDKRLPREYLTGLKKHFPGAEFTAFGGVPGSAYESISCHPDIYLFQIASDMVIYSPGIDNSFVERLRQRDINMIPGTYAPGTKYPETARYNALRVGGNVICSWQALDATVKQEIVCAGHKIIDVKQGYTRCAILKLSDNAIVTADRGIADSAASAGIEVLFVRNGNIELPGQRYGFMGGASGCTPDGKVVVLGDLGNHPAGEKVRKLADENGIGLCELSGLPLYDAGSMLIFHR